MQVIGSTLLFNRQAIQSCRRIALRYLCFREFGGKDFLRQMFHNHHVDIRSINPGWATIRLNEYFPFSNYSATFLKFQVEHCAGFDPYGRLLVEAKYCTDCAFWQIRVYMSDGEVL